MVDSTFTFIDNLHVVVRRVEMKNKSVPIKIVSTLYRCGVNKTSYNEIASVSQIHIVVLGRID